MKLASSKQRSVSVIVPLFNDADGVRKLLSELCGQSYSSNAVEVIIIDNGSRLPFSLDRPYPFHVRVLRCATPGAYAARNAGVLKASGEILAFTDADCWPDADWLTHGVSSLAAGGDMSVIGGDVSIVKPDKPTAVALYQYAVGFEQAINIIDKGCSATANLFCTRRQFGIVGPFDERLRSAGDREWCWRAAMHGINVRYEPKAVVYTRPRTSLRGAVRQARRIVAGRMLLRKLGLAHIGKTAVAKRRSVWQATLWILSNKNLRVGDRLRVLVVAVLIRGATAVESCRLAMGAEPERR